jgi:hypothetical protein
MKKFVLNYKGDAIVSVYDKDAPRTRPVYVEAKEAEDLEQLNKEMLEVLKEAAAMLLPDDESLGMYEYNVQQFAKKLKSIIAKAEEV